jgi:hypothetical protein
VHGWFYLHHEEFETHLMIIYATQQELNMICIAASLLKIIREITAMYKVHVSIFEK